MSIRAGGAALLCAGLFCLAAVARAEEQIEEVSIDYRDASCGSKETFLGRVQARTARFRLVERTSNTRHFDISIQPYSDSFRAQLSITSETQTPQTRQVESASCNELVEAMALMTALAIDPSVPSLEGSEVEPGQGEPAEGATSHSDESRSDETRNARLSPDKPTRAPPAKRPPEPKSPSKWKLGSGLHAVFNQGAVKTPLFGGIFDVIARSTRDQAFSPEARVFGLYQAGARIPAEVGATSFRLYGGGLSLCPVQLALGAASIRPCTTGALSTLAGRGHEVSDGRIESKPYATFGAGAHVSFPLHPRITVETKLGGHLPLRRDRFLLGTEVVSRASVVTGDAALGVVFWL